VVDADIYEMSPLNNDDNYTDGKDYFIKLKLSKGTHVFYFQISNGAHSVNSLASTIVVEELSEQSDFTHLDVVLGILVATAIFLVPLIYGTNQIRKLEQNLNKLANSNSLHNEQKNKKESKNTKKKKNIKTKKKMKNNY
jgi:mannitol-specific phosphotransferase system IIBC component